MRRVRAIKFLTAQLLPNIHNTNTLTLMRGSNEIQCKKQGLPGFSG